MNALYCVYPTELPVERISLLSALTSSFAAGEVVPIPTFVALSKICELPTVVAVSYTHLTLPTKG